MTELTPTDPPRLVVSPRLRIGWSRGQLRLGLAQENRSALFPDASVVAVLHAFATPRTPDEAALASGAPPSVVAQLAGDFLAAGFLEAAPPSPAATATASAALAGPPGGAPAAEGPAPAATVIMPTFERAAFLDLTLASYATQSTRDFELIVVDDGGADATAAVVARYAEELPIRFVRRPHAGRAAARNAALAVARGEVLIFSDDDRLVAPDFVEQHLRQHGTDAEPVLALGMMRGCVSLLQADMLGPTYGALARRLGGDRAALAARGEPVPLLGTDDVRHRFEETMRMLGSAEPDWERKVTPALQRFGARLEGLAVAWFLGSTGNLSVRRALVTEVGGFDAGYTGYGMEDTDLCYALTRAGARCVIAADAVSYHQLHTKPRVTAELARSLAYFCHKHDDLPALLFAAWFFERIDLAAANDVVMARGERGASDPVIAALHRALRAEVLPEAPPPAV